MQHLLSGNCKVEKVNISAVKNGEAQEQLTKKEKKIVWLTVLGIILFFGGMLKLDQWLVKEIEMIDKRKQQSLADLETRFRIITPDEYQTLKSNFESKIGSTEVDTKMMNSVPSMPVT